MKFELQSTVLFKKGKQGLLQRVDLVFPETPSGGKVMLSLKGEHVQLQESLALAENQLRYSFFLPEIKQPLQCQATLRLNDRKMEKQVILEPRKKWQVHLVHFSHTDTGYTDLPSRIARNHGRFLRQVLEYCRITDGYPDDAKFRWSIETAYQFQNGWERLTAEERQQLLARIREGRVELTPIYLSHNTELYDPEILWRTILYAAEFARRNDLQLVSAMNTDITGQPWALPQLLANAGIPYLSTAVNSTRGRAPEIPRAVYWESPDGSRVVLWNHDPNNAYIEGATLGFVSGYDTVLDKLHRYLLRYEHDDFPYDIIGFRTAGQHADNAGPVLEIAGIVRRWNEQWAYPQVIFSTNGRFLQALTERWGRRFPVYRNAWPDYWIDTFATVARETAHCRVAHEVLTTAEKLNAIASLFNLSDPYPHEEAAEAVKYLMLADEVDWCAFQATANPDHLQSKGQFYEQASFAYRGAITAAEMLTLGEYRLLPLIKAPRHTAVVFNPLSWQRSDVVRIEIPREILGDKFPQFLDEHGRALPCQKVGEGPGYREFALFAEDVPPLGYRQFPVEFTDRAGQFSRDIRLEREFMENRFYRIDFAADGSIAGIVDKESGQELVNSRDEFGFCQPVYEETIGGRPPVSLDKMADEEHRGSVDLDFMEFAHEVFPERFPDRDTRFNRICPKQVEVLEPQHGAVFSSHRLNTAVANVTRLERSVILYENIKRIELCFQLDKREVRDAEGLYIAFPFAVNPFQMELENAYTFLTPEQDQFPASCRDWYLAQKWIRLFNPQQQIFWSAIEAPLVQLGEIQTGRWLRHLDLNKGTIYSWLFNNYWWTNTPASQGGWNYRFRYAIGSQAGRPSRLKALHFGWAFHTPLRGWFLTAGQEEGRLLADRFSLCQVDQPDVIITAVKAAGDGQGTILRLFETAGKATAVEIHWNGPPLRKVYLANPVEQNLAELSTSPGRFQLEINPYQVITLRVLCESS